MEARICATTSRRTPVGLLCSVPRAEHPASIIHSESGKAIEPKAGESAQRHDDLVVEHHRVARRRLAAHICQRAGVISSVSMPRALSRRSRSDEPGVRLGAADASEERSVVVWCCSAPQLDGLNGANSASRNWNGGPGGPAYFHAIWCHGRALAANHGTDLSIVPAVG